MIKIKIKSYKIKNNNMQKSLDKKKKWEKRLLNLR